MPGSKRPSKLPPSRCQRSTDRPINGQTEISVIGEWRIWATCDARIYARHLALGGLKPRGELSFDLLWFVLGAGGLRESPGDPGKAHGVLWGASRGPPGPGQKT